MTDYEMVLLRAAVEACPDGFDWYPGRDGGYVFVPNTNTAEFVRHRGSTLADALTALLRDLGADVPEWPSEERVADMRQELHEAYDPETYLLSLPLPEYLALRGGS